MIKNLSYLKYVYISTFLFWLATNIIAPFLSIFAFTQIENVGVAELGIASMIFFLSFGGSILIVSLVVDKIKGLQDDFFVIFIGFILRGVIFILFIFVESFTDFLLIHFLLGATRGLTDVSQDKIITKLSNDEILSTSFGVRISITNFAAAIGSGIGGVLINGLGFKPVFFGVGIVTILSGIIFYKSKNLLLQKHGITKSTESI
jgi:sugar phosphate permease